MLYQGSHRLAGDVPRIAWPIAILRDRPAVTTLSPRQWRRSGWHRVLLADGDAVSYAP